MKAPFSRLLYKAIVYGLLFTESPFKFEKILDKIFTCSELSDSKIRYLKQLLMIKEKWTRAYCPHLFIAGTHSTSRAESVNSQIKAKLTNQTSLVNIYWVMDALCNEQITKSQQR
jgi:hypothetical protein